MKKRVSDPDFSSGKNYQDADSKLFILERLMTDSEQKAEYDIEVCMNGAGSSAQIISRSVGKGNSSQVFKHALRQLEKISN